MTNEEQIEEILMEAQAYGLRLEVIETAKKDLELNPLKDKVLAYSDAFHEWIK